MAGPGKRHSARGTPRAQPRDVRSAGRDTWNLTGEALGGPVEDHRLTRADGRQKVSLTVVLGMILRLIGTNPPQEPLSAVFWLWKLS